jgi:hypothetical protein
MDGDKILGDFIKYANAQIPQVGFGWLRLNKKEHKDELIGLYKKPMLEGSDDISGWGPDKDLMTTKEQHYFYYDKVDELKDKPWNYYRRFRIFYIVNKNTYYVAGGISWLLEDKYDAYEQIIEAFNLTKEKHDKMLISDKHYDTYGEL